MNISFASMKEVIRYKTIDRLIRGNTQLMLDANTGQLNPTSEKASLLTIEHFIAACNDAYAEHGISGKVGRSWVFEDIKFLKSKQGPSAPIETRRVNRVADYFYANPTFSLFNTEWFKEFALTTIERQLDVFDIDKIPNAPNLLELRTEILSQLSEYGQIEKIIYRSNDPNVKWHRWFDRLYSAIKNHEALEIEYQKFGSVPELHIVHPQIIKEWNRRYFLFGINQTGQIRNYPLDRVHSINTINIPYKKFDYDWDDHFDEVVGVTKYDNAELETVVLKLPLKEALYFESKPIINGPITINRFEDHYVFSFKVYLNIELENVIMSYLPNIEVIEPMGLKEKIDERINTYSVRN